MHSIVLRCSLRLFLLPFAILYHWLPAKPAQRNDESYVIYGVHMCRHVATRGSTNTQIVDKTKMGAQL